MDSDSIDASIGLEFSLELFKEYKASGILQAKLLRAPGVPKNSMASLQLIEGAIVACFIEERSGQRLPVTKAMLIHLDNERGPFEWQFHRSAPAASPPPMTSMSPVTPIPQMSPVAPVPPFIHTPPLVNRQPSQRLLYAVPRIVARLNWIQLRTWSYEQRQTVYLVWQRIDGKRTVQEIHVALGNQLPTTRVNEVLQFLLDIKVITIQ